MFHLDSNRFVKVYLLDFGRVPSLPVQVHIYQEAMFNIPMFLKLQNAAILRSLLYFDSISSIIWTEIYC